MNPTTTLSWVFALVPLAACATTGEQVQSLVALQHASAEELGGVLRELFEDSHPALPIVVVADAETNSLLVSGSEVTVAEAIELVARLDQKSDPAPKVIRLTTRISSELRQRLQEFLDEEYRPGRSAVSSKPMRRRRQAVVHDEGDSLRVEGPSYDIERIRQMLLERCDVSVPPAK